MHSYPTIVEHPHVMRDPRKFGGSAYIEGSRVLVRRLWAWYRKGTKLETLMRRYPQLGPAKLLDALAYAWDNTALMEYELAQENAIFEDEKRNPSGLAPPEQLVLPFGTKETSDAGS